MAYDTHLPRTIPLGLLLLALAACAPTGAPGCSDQIVQDLVIEITEDTLNKQGFNRAAIQEMSLSLSAIRTDSTDDEAKKCVCGATLAGSTGRDVQITYTAQYTEDNQVYVEVYDL